MDASILKKQLHDQNLPFRVLIVEHPELDFTISVYVMHSDTIGTFYDFSRRGDIPRRHKSISSAYNEVKRIIGIGKVERVEIISYATLASLTADHKLIHGGYDKGYKSGLPDQVKKRRKSVKKSPEVKNPEPKKQDPKK